MVCGEKRISLQLVASNVMLVEEENEPYIVGQIAYQVRYGLEIIQ